MSNQQMQAFTVSYAKMSNVLNAPVFISVTGEMAKSIGASMSFTSLWDTGATRSVVTRRVVETLGLMPVSTGQAATPQGTYEADMYYIDLMLPNRVLISRLLVMEGQPRGCDVLIGMDVICRGDLAVSNFNNQTTFTFRYPSVNKIDFVAQDKLQKQIGAHGKGTKKHKPKK